MQNKNYTNYCWHFCKNNYNNCVESKEAINTQNRTTKQKIKKNEKVQI